MTSIRPAKIEDAPLLAEMGKLSFLESHGHSASKEDMDQYVSEKYTEDVFINELKEEQNIYHIIYAENKPAGYSKILLNASHQNVEALNVTKLERFYLLKEFYGMKLGQELFHYNISLSKTNNQTGMWLFVWKENTRAIKFYRSAGFEIIGSHDFKISENHSNPNHQMFLKF